MSGPQSHELAGKTAIVTGGSRGIGRAIAHRFAAAGADVVVSSRDGGRCVEAAAEIARHGVRGVGIACDVADEGDIGALFDRVADELGGADIFVHCAGVSSVGKALEVDSAELRRMWEIHFLGGAIGARRAAAQMKTRGGGAILLVTSIWGLGGQVAQLAYGTAKAALAHAVRVLALEWAEYGIRVNGLAPGLVATEMTRDLPSSVRDALLRRVPLRRAAVPEEMAGPALFLCSDAASYVTGHVLVVDGGERAR